VPLIIGLVLGFVLLTVIIGTISISTKALLCVVYYMKYRKDR
jgi:hypothetical protein